jgi:hypothetical protein
MRYLDKLANLLDSDASSEEGEEVTLPSIVCCLPSAVRRLLSAAS